MRQTLASSDELIQKKLMKVGVFNYSNKPESNILTTLYVTDSRLLNIMH